MKTSFTISFANAAFIFMMTLLINTTVQAQWLPAGATTGNVYYNNGNVGIGTATPSQKLEVQGNLRINGSGGLTHSELTFYRADGFKFSSIGQSNLSAANSTFDIQNFNGNDIRFLNVGAEQLRIVATNGNVGIGTTTPTQKLEVRGNLRINGSGALTHSELTFYRGDGLKFSSIGQGNVNAANSTFDIQNFNGNDIRFLNNGLEQLRIVATNGNVGIGTTTPTQKLEVRGNLRINGSGGGNTHSELTFYRGDGLKFSSIGQGNVNAANSTFDIQNFNGNDIRFLNVGAEQLRIVAANGNVGIGTSIPDARLAVLGTIHSNEVRVDLNVPGPDYVFETSYKLPTLKEVSEYIQKNKHLPEVPSACVMEENGVNLGEMNMLLLKKVEELTLYMIEQNKQIREMKGQIEMLQSK